MSLVYVHSKKHPSPNWSPLVSASHHLEQLGSSLFIIISFLLIFFFIHMNTLPFYHKFFLVRLSHSKFIFPTTNFYQYLINQIDLNLWCFLLDGKCYFQKIRLKKFTLVKWRILIDTFLSFLCVPQETQYFSITVLVKPMSNPLHQLRLQ